ncbi:MAG: hypothetical protein GXO87_15235 [Chlorobi bacterium]|nr:hypothetical protein [Chlorobiota bacterium]
MKRLVNISFAFLIFALLLYSCKLGTDPGEGGQNVAGTVTITGTVLDSTTASPIEGASVTIVYGSENLIAKTNSDGVFSVDISIEENISVNVSIEYNDYQKVTLPQFNVTAGDLIDVGLINLRRKENSLQPSGYAASISLKFQTSASINVRESGGEETATITFLVTDSSGVPVDLNHRAEVTFELGDAPGGGEYINPESIQTNAFGEAITALKSGTKAGTVQFVAKTSNPDGTVIRSKPVFIAIHGGLPDQNHFSIAAKYSNIPGFIIFGFEDEILTIVGDKYSNPVKEGTAVYFKTTGGIVEGSILTDDKGEGTASLITGNPMPEHPSLGVGFATVTASTADENLNMISDDVIILFTGGPSNMSVNPTTFAIPNAGSQTFTYHVSDNYGHPLCSGSSILVAVTGEGAIASGDVSIVLPDTQSEYWTNFSFTISDADPLLIAPSEITVIISALSGLGSNSGNSIRITGTIN